MRPPAQKSCGGSEHDKGVFYVARFHPAATHSPNGAISTSHSGQTASLPAAACNKILRLDSQGMGNALPPNAPCQPCRPGRTAGTEVRRSKIRDTEPGPMDPSARIRPGRKRIAYRCDLLPARLAERQRRSASCDWSLASEPGVSNPELQCSLNPRQRTRPDKRCC